MLPPGSPLATSAIIYVTTMRFPSERAHALYIALTLESYRAQGARVAVVAARRRGRSMLSARAFFGLAHDIPVTYLPVIDLTYVPFMSRAAFALYSACFAVVSLVYALMRIPRASTYLFTADALVAVVLALFGFRVVYELHDYPNRARWAHVTAMGRSYRILTNTAGKKQSLVREFALDAKRIIVAHNAVDPARFTDAVSREDARHSLGIPQNEPCAVYTGSFQARKGVDTFAHAARGSALRWYAIGGSEEECARLRASYRDIPNLTFITSVPHASIPLWLRAAAVVVIPNSANDDISSRHTSPMKLFEYMASGTPIVASDVPAIREIVGEAEVLFVRPDDAAPLRTAVERAWTGIADSEARAKRAMEKARTYTWEGRARTVFMQLEADAV